MIAILGLIGFVCLIAAFEDDTTFNLLLFMLCLLGIIANRKRDDDD